MGEELKNFYSSDVTCISNIFLDKYLADINPVYLKVFLYIKWKGNAPISQIADDLNLTENDVEGAIKYWKKQKNKDGLSLSSITNVKSKANDDEDTPKKEHKTTSKPKKVEKSDKEKQEMLFYAESIFPQTLTSSQVKTLNYIFEDLDFDLKLVKYLLEYCVDIGKTSHSYIKTVADDWCEREITTVNLARKYIKERDEKTIAKKEKYKQPGRKQYVGINTKPLVKEDDDFDKIAMAKMRARRLSKKS